MRQKMEAKDKELETNKKEIGPILNENYELKFEIQELKNKEFLEGTVENLRRELEKRDKIIGEKNKEIEKIASESHIYRDNLQFDN